jgi:hypothetical protein
MTEKWRSLEYRIREAAYNAMKAKQEAAQVRLTTKVMEEPKSEPEPEVIKEETEEVAVETIEVVEAEPGQPDPMKDKMAQQKAQVQKQKDQLRMQIAQQRAAKQEQAMKEKGEKSLEKIKEDELDERMHQRTKTFGRASKLQKLHSAQYSKLSSTGNHAKAEGHRKRAIEYKRIMYQAKDNPDKLPV